MKVVSALPLLAIAATASSVRNIFNLISSGGSDDSHNGLYLSTQHIDPLNSDAVFRDSDDAADFYLDNGTVRYVAPNGAPFALALDSGDEVQGSVEISVSPLFGSTGFNITSDNTLETANQSWGGWLVCDRSDGLLGLYYENNGAGSNLLEECDAIALDVVYKPIS
ncbi:hypothetical protein ETB97_008332 [Aspergillus alliaceus]|uniref:DUF7907 domain-containing protein n=1 Tax=Petromyces alliaceus TaxID=209559 RepID=A0A5N6FJ14_PETAA|nr:uncharacterized protein BDW43DRAFT_314526 [Aspergillus alliaceus]KAB8229878.1 hypothetical protein BDW43DRAFT_314526 [Aspergillus alliaceus]KAF5855829.1 hypothetical protein ETB97_008332 [Aspergillus burnettii]